MKTVRTKQSEATAVERILAKSEAKVRVIGIYFVGVTLMLLTLSGLIAFFIIPQQAKEVWLTIGPILSGTVSGMLGFWAAKRGAKA